jgi:hypothetical protein
MPTFITFNPMITSIEKKFGRQHWEYVELGKLITPPTPETKIKLNL